MHELSIALNILDIVTEAALSESSAPVTAIHLRVGVLAGVVPAALVSAFELAREGTDFRETELRIEEMPIMGYCSDCGKPSQPVSVQMLCCVQCGAPLSEITSGRELEVAAIEVLS
jgi:hydrogenase nickel incorporation protein HypA/HybF